MNRYDKYEAVIGLEIHAQLLTKTKAYSSDENICHAVNLESLLLTATSCGAGVKVSITAQSLLSETGRDAG